MDVLAIIPARGGSKRIPRKNIKPLLGKPLVAYAIEQAAGADRVTRVLVSTDDDEVARVAWDWGADVPFVRPASLAADHVGTVAVERHALRWLAMQESYEPDIIVRVNPTSPLREPADIDQCVDIVRGAAPAVLSVSEFGNAVQRACRVVNGRIEPLFGPDTWNRPSQDFDRIYYWNGAVHAARTDYFREQGGYHGPETAAYVMPHERGIDIDTMDDWYRAERALRRRAAA